MFGLSPYVLLAVGVGYLFLLVVCYALLYAHGERERRYNSPENE